MSPKQLINRLARVACLLLLIPLAGCGGSSSTGQAGSGLKVVATTGPVGDMVTAIVGPHGSVEVMMGPGIDPHLYKERPSDIAKIEGADIVFFSGLHMEGRMAEVLERRGEQKPVFALTQRLLEAKDERLRYPDEFEGFPDPHVWHDAGLWAECVAVVVDRLAKIDPDHAADYQAAGEKYRTMLTDLDAELRASIESIPAERRVMVTAHDAFGYFSRAYGLESVGMKGISTEDEVSLSRMDEVAQLVIDRKLPAVFVESSVAPRVIEALIEPCKQAGHDVEIGGELYADALGSADSGAETYAGMMRANVATLVEALGGEPAAAE